MILLLSLSLLLPILCLYSNVFFFAILILISQFFPVDLYLATFYTIVASTFFISFVALIILFAPKFW